MNSGSIWPGAAGIKRGMNYRPGTSVPSAAAGKIPISGAKVLLPEQFGYLWQFSNPAKNLNIRQVFLKNNRKF